MLDHNNLEEFADPRNYDIEQRTNKGIAFYSALAQETGGPVLEVACGTGRVSIPIARLGLDVTGLDIVPGMLEQARAKSAGLPVRWVEGDQEHTKVTRIAVRYTFPQELEALLHYNGFTIARQYGDWQLGPLTPECISIISVCRKRK